MIFNKVIKYSKLTLNQQISKTITNHDENKLIVHHINKSTSLG